MVPNGASGLLIGVAPFLSGTQIPGAPAGALPYVTPLVLLSATNTAASNVTYPLPVPCSSGLSGAQLTTQLIDFDAALGTLVPIGTSRGQLIVVGN